MQRVHALNCERCGVDVHGRAFCLVLIMPSWGWVRSPEVWQSLLRATNQQIQEFSSRTSVFHYGNCQARGHGNAIQASSAQMRYDQLQGRPILDS